MSEGGAPGARARGAGWGRVWQALALILAFCVIEQDVEALLWETYRLPGAGTLGAGQLDLAPAPDFAPGYVSVGRLAAGSPLARAGVVVGDHLRFDRTFDYLRYPRAGETIGFALDHRGRRKHLDVAAAPRTDRPENRRADTYGTLFVLSCLIPALFAAFIAWRSHGKPVPLLLGAALSSFSLAWVYPQMWEGVPAVFPGFFGVTYLDLSVIFALFLAFAMRFAEVTVGRLRSWEWRLLAAYAVASTAVAAVCGYCAYYVAVLPLVGDGSGLLQILSYPAFAASFYYMFKGWRRSQRADRKRYALLLAAFSAVVIAQMIITAFYWGMHDQDIITNPIQLVGEVLTGIVAPVLFTYAILRHKVLDLGFAINRTLVYGVVSAILLAAFGLVEWGVDHFVPIKGREKNVLVDAAIAVGVFLTFHRVRDGVEHLIEGLFFRRWQKAEAALRRFVREAAFITEPAALTRAFAKALSNYAEGAETAVYLVDGRRCERADGQVTGVPARLDADLPIMVRLRADLKPVGVPDGDLSAALIAPMVNRNQVIGAVVLGPLPSGLDFRPDEIELIAWATRQVGLDLHALKMERLEADRARQNEQIAVLRNEVATLRSVIPQRV